MTVVSKRKNSKSQFDRVFRLGGRQEKLRTRDQKMRKYIFLQAGEELYSGDVICWSPINFIAYRRKPFKYMQELPHGICNAELFVTKGDYFWAEIE